jgi:hypothetical protein
VNIQLICRTDYWEALKYINKGSNKRIYFCCRYGKIIFNEMEMELENGDAWFFIEDSRWIFNVVIYFLIFGFGWCHIGFFHDLSIGCGARLFQIEL